MLYIKWYNNEKKLENLSIIERIKGQKKIFLNQSPKLRHVVHNLTFRKIIFCLQ